MVEMSKVAGSKLRPSCIAVLKDFSRRTAEPPLEVLPISVRSPATQNSELPPTSPEEKGRDCLGTEGDEDSLLTNAELATGVVSSILRESDLKKADFVSVEEALALSLQGAVTVCLDAFIYSLHRCFKLSINFISFLQMATYMKSLARGASFTMGSTRAVKAYEAKVASLTFEKVDLQA